MPSIPKPFKAKAVKTELCEFLEWDSQFFGRRIGRLKGNRLTPELVPEIIAWCRAERIECLYFLANADSIESTDLAARHGFKLMDIRVTFEQNLAAGTLPEGPNELQIRHALLGDLPALRTMAGRLHEGSRFFADQHFPRDLSRELYRVWIEKSSSNPCGTIFVAEQQQLVGYLACRVGEAQTGQIDLLGINHSSQAHGFGRALVRAALRWFESRSVHQVLVVTQGRNIRAQKLYQKCGFVTRSVQLWYHLWFEESLSPRTIENATDTI
jgi:dTDP-4-amino-4,6-dideoxy-D-galactose acyltransferase